MNGMNGSLCLDQSSPPQIIQGSIQRVGNSP